MSIRPTHSDAFLNCLLFHQPFGLVFWRLDLTQVLEVWTEMNQAIKFHNSFSSTLVLSTLLPCLEKKKQVVTSSSWIKTVHWFILKREWVPEQFRRRSNKGVGKDDTGKREGEVGTNGKLCSRCLLTKGGQRWNGKKWEKKDAKGSYWLMSNLQFICVKHSL